MSAPAPLRHYYAADDRPESTRPPNTCAREDCGRPESDPVHLEPGDDTAYHDAIRAASPHSESNRTPEQDARAVKRAAARTAHRHARYTFGMLRDRPRAPREAG